MTDQIEPLAEVKSIYSTNFRQVAATLRVIADGLDKGEYGEVTEAAVVMKVPDGIDMFGLGAGQTGATTALLFHAAAIKMAIAASEP